MLLAQNTRPREFRVYGRFHAVRDEIVCLALAEQFAYYAGPGWYGMILCSDGRGFERGEQDWGQRPDDEQRERMTGVLVAANREIANGGHWTVAWSMIEDALVVLYRDADGDVQFSWESPRWHEFKGWCVKDVLDQLATAHLTWQRVSREVEARPEQQVRLARGEKPKPRPPVLH